MNKSALMLAVAASAIWAGAASAQYAPFNQVYLGTGTSTAPAFSPLSGDCAMSSTTLGAISCAKFAAWCDPVADYGADPTGKNDSSSAINSCFGSGRQTHLPAGTYSIHASLRMKPGLGLWCADGATITQPNNQNLSILIDFSTNAANGSSIHNCTIDGNRSNNTDNGSFLVYVGAANDVVISNNTLINGNGYGVDVQDGLRPYIVNNKFTNLYTLAIGIGPMGPQRPTYAQILNNTLYGYLGQHAIILGTSDYNTIQGNTINGLLQNGMTVTVNGPPPITGVTGNGTTLTYTVAGWNSVQPQPAVGSYVNVNGLSPGDLNCPNCQVVASTATSVTVNNTATDYGSVTTYGYVGVSTVTLTGCTNGCDFLHNGYGTGGLSPGEFLILGGTQSNYTELNITSITDATHLIANMGTPTLTGMYASGGVGDMISLNGSHNIVAGNHISGGVSAGTMLSNFTDGESPQKNLFIGNWVSNIGGACMGIETTLQTSDHTQVFDTSIVNNMISDCDASNPATGYFSAIQLIDFAPTTLIDTFIDGNYVSDTQTHPTTQYWLGLSGVSEGMVFVGKNTGVGVVNPHIQNALLTSDIIPSAEWGTNPTISSIGSNGHSFWFTIAPGTGTLSANPHIQVKPRAVGTDDGVMCKQTGGNNGVSGVVSGEEPGVDSGLTSTIFFMSTAPQVGWTYEFLCVGN